MDPVIILVVIIGGLVVLGLLINKRLTELKESQKPSDELLEIIRTLQSGSREDRKSLLDSLQKNSCPPSKT